MTTITALPVAPSRADPTTFSARGDAFLGALGTFVTETNTVAGEVNTNASTASTAATTATTQAGIATTGASTATTQATIATAAASAASTSATSASTSAIAASKLNLGNKTSAPSVDNQGATLLAGATYYDTTLNKWRVYSGSAWTDGISAVAGVSSVNSVTGAVTLKTINSTPIDGSGNITTGDVTLAGVQTLTNKTITEIVYTLTGTTPALLCTNGAVQTWTLSANSTPTDSLTTGQSIILVITPSSFTVTWPSVVWAKQGGSGTAPVLFSAGKTTVVLWKIGSILYGSYLGDTV